MRRNGVDIAVEKAGGGPEGFKAIANTLGMTVNAIYNFRRRGGWFPTDRARVIAEKFDIPLVDLVRDDVREALLSNNS